MGSRRKGLLLTPNDHARGAWLERAFNHEEWARLRMALDLADGFMFVAVLVRDQIAARYLGELLEAFSAEQGVPLGEIELGQHATVAAVLERLRATPKPGLFWVHCGDESADLSTLFALLNQKREVISTLANAPLVLALHPQSWAHFRRYAPDFWSIHQLVARFSPGRAPRPRDDTPRTPTPERFSSRPRPSGWRITAAELARLAAPNFFGRESEIRFLVATLASPGARIIVHGPGGVGKTALLRYVIPRVAPHYPHGIWWVPFDEGRYRAQGLARAREVLDRLVHELSPDGMPIPSVVHREVFEQLVGTKRALFVFEDVNDLAACECLLTLRTGSGAAMVITTRLRPPPGRFDQVLALGGLEAEASAALLQARAPLDPETARRVANATANNPSMLTLSAAILADDPKAALLLTQHQYARALAAEQPSPVVHAAIERVLAETTARALWPVLGLFRATFGPVEVAAIEGGGPQAIAPGLAELARLGLIERTASPDEYRFFPALRGIAAGYLDRSEGANARRLAHARWALNQRARLEIDQDARAAIDWLRDRYAAEQALREPIWAVLEVAIDKWREADSADPIMQLGLEIGEARGERRLLARVYAWFGAASLRRGELAQAKAWYQAKIDLSHELRDRKLASAARIGLGDVALASEDPGQALARYQAALVDGAEHLPAAELAQLYTKMGSAASISADDDSAALYYQSALRSALLARADRVGDRADATELMIGAYRGLAAVAFNQGDYEASHGFLGALMQLTSTEERADWAQDHALLAAIEQARGDYEAASQSYARALAILERSSDQPGLVPLLLDWGQLEQTRGDLTTARSLYERAVQHAERGDVHGRVDHESLGTSLHRVGECLSQQGLEAEARDWFERAKLSSPAPGSSTSQS